MIEFPFRILDRTSVRAAGVAFDGIKLAFASVCVARSARDRERERMSHEHRGKVEVDWNTAPARRRSRLALHATLAISLRTVSPPPASSSAAAILLSPRAGSELIANSSPQSEHAPRLDSSSNGSISA